MQTKSPCLPKKTGAFAPISYNQSLALASCASLTKESATNNQTVHIRSDHLLSVTSHHALAGNEVLGTEDRRGDLERYIRSVYIATLKEATALTTNKDRITGEVRTNINIPLLGYGTNLNGGDASTFIVCSDSSTEATGELKNVGNFRSADEEVSATTQSLTVDCS